MAAENREIGIRDASKSPTIELAIQKLAGKLWDVVDDGQGRDKVVAAKTIMQLAQLTPDRRSQQDNSATNIQQNVFGNDAIELAERYLRIEDRSE